jgi:TonB family protein
MRKSYYVASTLIIIASAAVALAMRPESSSTEQHPAVASAVAPAYPVLAVASNTSGTVEVEVKVSASGEVISARSVNGHPLLRQKAEDTARRWRFIPAVNDASVRPATLTFVFRIMPKETAGDDLTPMFTPPYQVEVRNRPFEPVVDSDPPTYVRPTRQRGRRRTP